MTDLIVVDTTLVTDDPDAPQDWMDLKGCVIGDTLYYEAEDGSMKEAKVLEPVMTPKKH